MTDFINILVHIEEYTTSNSLLQEWSKDRLQCKMSFTSQVHERWNSQYLELKRNHVCIWNGVCRFRSVVVITLASHARGPGLEPQREQHTPFTKCSSEHSLLLLWVSQRHQQLNARCCTYLSSVLALSSNAQSMHWTFSSMDVRGIPHRVFAVPVWIIHWTNFTWKRMPNFC